MGDMNFGQDSEDYTIYLSEIGQIPNAECIKSDGSSDSGTFENPPREAYYVSAPYPYGSMTPEDLALRRERNRLAAAKCRAKKAEKFNVLKNYHDKLVTDNQKLKEQNLELKNELELQKIKLQYATMNTNSVNSQNHFHSAVPQSISNSN